MQAFQTWVEVQRYIEEHYANPTAFNYHDDAGWHAISTQEFVQSVKALVLGLHAIGLKRGDRVGILAQPSPRWTMADIAIILAGGIAVPLFANISEENFLYEISQTELKIIFIEGLEPWQIFERHQKRFDVGIALDNYSHVKAMPFEELIELGNRLHEREPARYEQIQASIKSQDIAAIIYTSGSTGIPKGVELTQHNIACSVNFDSFHWKSDQDRYLSVLPLAHVFGHCINFWMMAWGVSIFYSNDYKKIGAVSQEIKPTATVVVPRLLEKVYARMEDQLHRSSGFKRWVAEQAFALAKMEKTSVWKTLLKPVADKLVYGKLRKALGGKLRVVISGGAPLNPHLHHFFSEIGIPIYEGWGLTEACPVCVNFPGQNKEGAVGPPVTGQKLKIGSAEEVLVKGCLVMHGYYRNPTATAQTIDSEGWLHTGDRGYIDAEGFLTILGRIKELYKTSTGEYVAPVPIEQAIARHPLIEMAMVIAEGRKFTSCLLFPNKEALDRLKAEHKQAGSSDEAFLQSDFIRQEMKILIDDVNAHLNHWEQIQDYRFVMEPLTIQGGELTPSMKIRREVVAKKYSGMIDAIYQEERQ